jgi:hypothetical protein
MQLDHAGCFRFVRETPSRPAPSVSAERLT